MKKVVIIMVLCVLSLTLAAQNVAKKYIPDKSKPVLMVFTADWCAPCKAMQQSVFTVDSVASALSGYNVLLVDIDTPAGAAYQERFCRKEVQIPYFVVLDRSGAVRNRKLGAMQAGEFMNFLKDSGTLNGSGAVGAVKYVKVPDRENFAKGWEFEAGAGSALVTTSEDKLFKPAAVVSAGARYRTTRLVAFRVGVDGLYTFNSFDFIPKISIAVPLDLELYLVDPAYLSLGAFVAVNNTAKVKVAPDFGVRVGAGCKLGSFDVHFSYNIGVLNLNKGDIVNRVSASALALTVAYCF